MGSVHDTQTPKQQYLRFPLSPPNSTTVTAHSSPRLNAVGHNDSEILDTLLTSPPFLHRANSQTVRPWSQSTNDHVTDSDGTITDTKHTRETQRMPSKRVARKQAARALTLPSTARPSTADKSTTLPPAPKSSRPLTRRSSSYSTTSSSSSQSPDPLIQHPLNSGIGRKVAASLQLFKESTAGPSSEENKPREPRRPESSSGPRRPGSSHKPDDVAEPQFEFVKRSEWPDREAAAFRRDKSSTALDRVRTRDSVSSNASLKEADVSREKERKLSVRDNVIHDLAQWRKDVVSRQDSRGRRRERTTDDPVFDIDLGSPEKPSSSSPFHNGHDRAVPPSPFIRPHSRAYPPSPSPSRSPVLRIPPLPPIHTHTDRNEPELSPSQNTPRSHSRPPSPIPASSPQEPQLLLPSPRLSLDPQSFSPWSTDDESAWETASATTTTSTTSATSSFPLSNSLTYPYPASSMPVGGESEFGQPDYLHFSQGSREDVEEDDYLDLDIDWSQENLPHIPLRPFRNQVGGHSAIYKFTKRAVCKPLVSRENLFYESVEREAPPLLGFIPRYLGVMLVTYRRVPKGTHSPSIDSPDPPAVETPPPARPPIHKAASERLVSSGKGMSRATSIQSAVPEEDEGGDTDRGEAEMPEVLLDRNRHIIPEWMLRGGRNRSLSQSYVTGAHSLANRHLNRLHLNGGTASSPDLGLPGGSTPRARSSHLAKYHRLVPVEMDAPTPANSPNITTRILSSPSSYADGPRRHFFLRSDADELDGRPSMHGFHSEQGIRLPQSPGWFGGTGSTMVHTKFKDHVFSTVLRRFRKRSGRCALGARTEDEGDIADAEGDDVDLGAHVGRVRPRVKIPSTVHRIKQQELGSHDQCIRRVQSELIMTSPGKQKSMAEEQKNKESAEVFEFDYDQMKSKTGSNDMDATLPPSIARRRSRSRSLDTPTKTQRSQPSLHIAERGSIPEQSELDPTVTRQNHFILMEDLTGRLKNSCVLDLKMGTRQYGMDATPAKKKSQRKKCDRTTSRTLGVRVCGMQVWNHVTQSYMTQDKYQGREVHPEEFPSVLASFLYDGERLLAHQIPILLQKIYALARIINRLKGYRFYGCSLLLIYDGDREAQDSFRSSVLEHPSSRSKRGESLERQASRTRPDSKHEKAPLRRSHSEDLLLGPVAKRSSGRRKRGEINVRIVDFAHTTTGRDWLPYPPSIDRTLQELTSSKGYQAEVDPETGLIYARFPPHYPDQPDRGFLFGLKSLALTLEKIWNEERIRRIKASRDDPSMVASQLPPIFTDGKEIFDEIFGPPETNEDPGMIST